MGGTERGLPRRQPWDTGMTGPIRLGLTTTETDTTPRQFLGFNHNIC